MVLVKPVPLEERHVVVVGASRGLGEAIVRCLGERAAHVTMVARNKKELEEASKMLANAKRLGWYSADLTDPGSLDALAKEVGQISPPASALVITAAGFYKGAFREMTAGQIVDLIAANFSGPILLMQKLLPLLAGNAYSDIVNVSSWSAATSHDASRSSALHIASKVALQVFDSCLGEELRPKNIRVTTLAPSTLAKGNREGLPLVDLARLVVTTLDLPPTLRIDTLAVDRLG